MYAQSYNRLHVRVIFVAVESISFHFNDYNAASKNSLAIAFTAKA